MELTFKPNTELTSDVVVVGGGTAGVFAAISAARTGAKTILIEKNSVLGGTMTVANVNFPGLFFAWGKQIINGPCWESIERTINLGGAKMPEITYKPERHWHEQILLNKFIYTSVLFEMCEEAGVEVMCNSMLSAVNETDDHLIMNITDKNGLFSIRTKTAVDATGDANLIQMAGFPVVKSQVQQPATSQNHISGYELNEDIENEIREKFQSAKMPDYITANNIIFYLKKNKFDIHIPCIDADTSRGKTQLERNAYSQLLALYTFLRSIKGLENLEIDFVAGETGVRETNRIVGEKTITAEDYINGVFYRDSICYAFYPIDRHVISGIEQRFLKENVVPKIPYSALIPKNSKRIICAGRCIGSDTDANSAVRVEAVCMATGQAAGCAAAIAGKRDIELKNVSYKELCDSLIAIHAIVPKKNNFS